MTAIDGQLRGNKECPSVGVTKSLEEGAGKRCYVRAEEQEPWNKTRCTLLLRNDLKMAEIMSF